MLLLELLESPLFDSLFGSLGAVLEALGELGLEELELDEGEDGEADGGVGDDELELDDGLDVSARGDIGLVDEDEDEVPLAPGLPGSPLLQAASAIVPTLTATRSLIMLLFMRGSP